MVWRIFFESRISSANKYDVQGSERQLEASKQCPVPILPPFRFAGS
jgi:hypothetical protein